MKKKIKKIIFILIIISLSFILAIDWQNNRLEVNFFDVGQGDSCLIEINNINILIDGGPDNIVLKRLGEALNYLDREIDIVVLSHYHDDHLTGLLEVIKRYEVGQIIYLKNDFSSLVFEQFLQTIKSKNIQHLALDNMIELNLYENCSLLIFSPEILSIPPDGNNSLIAKLNCFGQKFLLAGDNEYKVEKALLESGIDLSADFFKASHHGSKTSNKKYFLQAINPQAVIISAGKDNRFGHPSLEVLKDLNDLGVKIYRTDQQGTISFIFN